jgi:hypothetical protein
MFRTLHLFMRDVTLFVSVLSISLTLVLAHKLSCREWDSDIGNGRLEGNINIIAGLLFEFRALVK